MPGISNLACSGAWTKSCGRDLVQQRDLNRGAGVSGGASQSQLALEFVPKGWFTFTEGCSTSGKGAVISRAISRYEYSVLGTTVNRLNLALE